MPKEVFITLSSELRKIWINIPNDMKAVMLRSRNGNLNEGVNHHSKDIHETLNPLSYPLEISLKLICMKLLLK